MILKSLQANFATWKKTLVTFKLMQQGPEKVV